MTALATKDQLTFQDGNGHSIAPPIEFDPTAAFMLAITKGASIEVIERASALVERWQDKKAQQAFADALAGFQHDMPRIVKSRKADRFKYAGFDDIMLEASPILSRHGISIGFDSAHLDKALSVTCRIRVGSYHEDRTFTVPVPASLKVSEPQQYGAALQYAKRYCLCAALNIVVTDEDNEAAMKPHSQITPDMANDLRNQVQGVNGDVEKFLNTIGVAEFEDMTHDQYRNGLALIAQKRKARK